MTPYYSGIIGYWENMQRKPGSTDEGLLSPELTTIKKYKALIRMQEIRVSLSRGNVEQV